jgi:crossover junction endodeoxyribonuclease RuvC
MSTRKDTILSLDLGTVTGWAIATQDGSITSGTESFKPQRFEGGGMRYLRFKRWLAEVRTLAGGLDAVFFEEVRGHVGVDAGHVYGGFLATVTAWCEHHRVPYWGVPVGTLKKHATGKGNSNKAGMVAAVRAKGYTPADDNEADAIALLLWAIEMQEVEPSRPQVDQGDSPPPSKGWKPTSPKDLDRALQRRAADRLVRRLR